ncbi:predicted protein [Naegleria gruberi]|uniref:Predicted protein n=1 Tax=Naegleria gruberi TaxID=5762 RepID=D2VV18_NAEGR|nr:uncharacterized protein NAEGRDRAFT_52487 [Naegleria gruberi]EFC39363.1 predicted protein [Naegleria gruberi]|eukprot:XP_002672107.1 predicted protein [Naegleria gruberi strain NEG-M]
MVRGMFGSELEEQGLDYFGIIEKDVKPMMEQMMKSFNIENDDDCGTTLSMVNSIFLSDQFTLLESYHSLVNQTFNAKVDSCDFVNNQEGEIAKINKFVSDFTKGMIQNIVDCNFIQKTTRIVSLNGIYFAAQWKDQFDPSETKKKPFFTCDGSDSVSIEMMIKKDTRVLYGNDDPDEDENPQYHWIKLPYRSEHSMIIIMPMDKTEENDVFDKWIVEKLERMYYFSTESITMDRLSLPKMKIKEKVNLNDVFKSEPFNMKSMFSENANFERMIQNDHLPITDIFHECVIEINEEGTKASAITIKGRGKSAKSKFYFDVNRPFVMLITENCTQQVLFISKINNLSSSE